MHLEAVGFSSLETRSHASLEHKKEEKKEKKRKETGETFPSTLAHHLPHPRDTLFPQYFTPSRGSLSFFFLALDKNVNAEFQWNSIVSNFMRNDGGKVGRKFRESLFYRVVGSWSLISRVINIFQK